MRPEEPKKIFLETAPLPPYLRSGWPSPPYLKFWIRLCRILNTINFMNFLFEQICNLMILYKCFIIVLRDWNTSSYDPQPCTEKLGNDARQITKVPQFLGTKWAPCDKGPSRTLTDYKGLSSQTIIYFFTCCFWVISISRLLFWNNICNNNKNKFEQDWKFTSHYICWRWGG